MQTLETRRRAEEHVKVTSYLHCTHKEAHNTTHTPVRTHLMEPNKLWS
jgi:hypothetical protein